MRRNPQVINPVTGEPVNLLDEIQINIAQIRAVAELVREVDSGSELSDAGSLLKHTICSAMFQIMDTASVVDRLITADEIIAPASGK